MNRLFQFLRKLLIAALAGVFISIGTFPGEVTALTLAQIQQTPSGVSSPEEINLLELATGRATNTPHNTCPDGSGKPFTNPVFVSSQYGDLDITLRAAKGSINFGTEKSFDGLLYSVVKPGTEDKGLYTPPTLRVWPNDTINLTLINELPSIEISTSKSVPQDTNLHYHGFNVSPLLGSDDVVMHVHSGNDYQMKVDIPSTHQSGLFWYHPHVHTTSENQVLGGMSGGIIVEGIQKYYPIIKGIPLKNLTNNSNSSEDIPPLTEQVMLFKDFMLTSDQGEKFNCFTLNGLIHPKIYNNDESGKDKIRPGQVVFWRIANIGADTYLNLSLQDSSNNEQLFYILARDGNIVTSPIEQKRILLPPASRVEVLVVGGDLGKYTLYSLNPDAKSKSDIYYTLATVETFGERVNYDTKKLTTEAYILAQTPTELDPSQPAPDELAQLYIPNNHKRTFTFSGPYGGEFKINNKVYDENRIDTTVKVGDIEEWTLLNESKAPGHHAFHIHQLDFLVTKINNQKQTALGYQDTIDLPPCISFDEGTKTCNIPSKTVVRIPFVNPVITGVFVYHCHILGHEDKGMMQNIKVINPPLAAPVRDVF